MSQVTSTKKIAQKAEGFTAEEKAAMREAAKERKETLSKEEAEAAVVAKIAELEGAERAMAERLHALIKANAPVLAPKLWYGMPAYARDGKNVCFFQSAQKFNTRYATLGFSDVAKIDEGTFWPVAFALKELTPAVEAKIVELVKKAVD
jgi:uncharacterized protein YdhG (YjbR/CyaY superfamily)